MVPGLIGPPLPRIISGAAALPATPHSPTIIGLRPAEKVELESRLGAQRFSWNGLQPQVGTIRRFLLEADASQGDTFYLI